MRPYSRRRAKRDAVLPERRQQARERAQGRCEAGAFCCTGQVEQVHHIEGRTGPDPHRLSNLLAVCAACHDFITTHPEAAVEAGWSRSRLGPVRRSALLGEDAT